MHKLVAENLAKRFGPLRVFSDISFEVSSGEVLSIVGPNGPGKTTLMLLLLRAGHATRGEVRYLDGDSSLDEDSVRRSTSLVAPYLNLYDNLTAEENLWFFASVSGYGATGKQINGLLKKVALEGRGHDLVTAYSSGMKQRLKYAVALLTEPSFLFLDEPTSNLDSDGKRIVFDLIEELRKDRVIVIATNEEEEQNLADKLCRVNQ
jgi:heme exporter protein A